MFLPGGQPWPSLGEWGRPMTEAEAPSQEENAQGAHSPSPPPLPHNPHTHSLSHYTHRQK